MAPTKAQYEKARELGVFAPKRSLLRRGRTRVRLRKPWGFPARRRRTLSPVAATSC